MSSIIGCKPNKLINSKFKQLDSVVYADRWYFKVEAAILTQEELRTRIGLHCKKGCGVTGKQSKKSPRFAISPSSKSSCHLISNAYTATSDVFTTEKDALHAEDPTPRLCKHYSLHRNMNNIAPTLCLTFYSWEFFLLSTSTLLPLLNFASFVETIPNARAMEYLSRSRQAVLIHALPHCRNAI